METLPYEILQYIASYLLPRYQCRFALTSRHNYKYLYNDLLKWHALKDKIPVPIHQLVNDYVKGTLLFTGKNVLIYSITEIIFGGKFYYTLDVENLSTRMFSSLEHTYGIVKRINGSITIRRLRNITANVYKKYLNAYHKYLHKDILLILVNKLQVPYIYRINVATRNHILSFLSMEDTYYIYSCDHLKMLLSY